MFVSKVVSEVQVVRLRLDAFKQVVGNTSITTGVKTQPISMNFDILKRNTTMMTSKMLDFISQNLLKENTKKLPPYSRFVAAFRRRVV